MKTFFCFVLLLLCPAFAAAQSQPSPDNQGPPPHHPMGGGPMGGGVPGMPELGHDWWRNSEIAQAINLTDPQKQQLNRIFSSHREKLIQSRGAVENEEGKLHDLLDQDQPQQNDVLAQVTQLQTARNGLEKEFTVMSLEFRGVLSPDQWKQLQKFTHERMMKRMFLRRPDHGEPGKEMPQPPQE